MSDCPNEQHEEKEHSLGIKDGVSNEKIQLFRFLS